VDKFRRKNMLLIFSDNVLFTNAMTFLSVNAIITYFLATLGASTFEIGLANALVAIGAFISQPVYAKKVTNLSMKLKTFVRILLTQRIFFFLFVCSIPLFSESYPRLMVILFLICWAIFNWFTGSYSPFYMSVFAKMIAVNQRGRLRGFSGAVANLLALASALLAGFLLKEVPFPFNYTIIFAIGAIILIMDAILFAFMKEEPDLVTPIETNYFQYFLAIPTIFRDNKKFMSMVISFTFMVVSHVSSAYYALYAVRFFEAGAKEIALLAAITGMVNIVGNIVFGIIADKLGHRLILIISSTLGALGGFLVAGIPHIWAVYAAFALINLSMSGYNLSCGILIIENVQREKLPMCISINTLVTLVVASFVMLGSSFLVDYISFAVVFIIAGMAGLIGSLTIVEWNYMKIIRKFRSMSR
jgi:MFS family permease